MRAAIQNQIPHEQTQFSDEFDGGAAVVRRFEPAPFDRSCFRGEQESPSCSSIRTGQARSTSESTATSSSTSTIRSRMVYSPNRFGRRVRGRRLQDLLGTVLGSWQSRARGPRVPEREEKRPPTCEGGHAGIRQGRLYLDAGYKYDGSLWVKREEGSPQLTLRFQTLKGGLIASLPLTLTGPDWQEVNWSFTSPVRDTQATVEIAAAGSGTLLVDFISMMRADVRRDGMLRPDLLQALRDLRPSFIRWPGGSFASTYKWKEGIGRYAARGYHPNTFWGGYSDYFGFGTEEFLGLCRKIGPNPSSCLPAPGTNPEQVEYAMDWVRYLNDPPTTQWGGCGHPTDIPNPMA